MDMPDVHMPYLLRKVRSARRRRRRPSWSCCGASLALVMMACPSATSMCSNRCSGHGDCNSFGRCDCWSGWSGGDCSERACPTGLAWSGEATAVDNAHGNVECSNRGSCNRITGRCKCMGGFSGSACERSDCPRSCSGHGRCRSMSKFAEDKRDAESVRHTYAEVWDSDKLHTCVCDTGYHGYDCSMRTCPTGDDPLTTGQVNEVQLVVCQATAGSFVLYYEGYATTSILHDASEHDVENALETIAIIHDVDVEFSASTSGACNTSLINVIQVEFLSNFGTLRPMWSYNGLTAGSVTELTITADGSTVYDSEAVGYDSVKGTKENEECSNRGMCDPEEGICECFTSNDDIFASSDGHNGPGTRGDCGFQVTTTAGCPGEVACSGHGTCDENDFTCNCNHGWTSGDCSQRSCPYGRSWFSYPSEDEKAHDERTECSDGGLCNRDTGECECGGLFHGAACEYMICPGGITDACHGHGRCMTMAELALAAESNGDATDHTYGEDPNEGSTWDAHRVYGCLCDDGYGGYDCTEWVCPTGDDPGSWGQKAEVQLITCQATRGTFTLTFRQEETDAILANATSSDVEDALESLATLDDVAVTFATGSSVCTDSSTDVTSITFVTQHGDVPLVTADVSLLVDDGNGGALGSGNITIAIGIEGTTEDETCSNRGICDRSTGECVCFPGWASSNGAGGIGDKSDCGYRVPMTTHLRGSQWGEGNAMSPMLESNKVSGEAAYRDMSQIAAQSKLDALSRRKDMLVAAQQYQ